MRVRLSRLPSHLLLYPPFCLCMCVCVSVCVSARADNGNYIVDLAFKDPIKDVR